MANVALEQPSGDWPQVLVVDDDRIARMMLGHLLGELGYVVHQATNGKEALGAVRQRAKELDAILLDRNMPEMDGMEVVARIKESRELRWLPIIMQTGADRKEEIREGIEAGVFYYLTKPIDVEVLKSVIGAASHEARQHRQLLRELAERRASFQFVDSCKCTLRTLPQADLVAGLLASCFPDPERVIAGVAELLYNAVEHGNLGITYEEKTALIRMGAWEEEVACRAEDPENVYKHVEAVFQRSPDGCRVTIKDEGEGFPWRNYLKVDPNRAADNHGRGIAQANLVSFDTLTFSESGNEVTGFASNKKGLEW